MDFKYLKFEQVDSVGVLKINRPEALNALNSALIDELSHFFSKSLFSTDIRALVVTGEGKAFVAGADISGFQNMKPEEAHILSEKGQRLFDTIEGSRVPVLALVNGFALGGGLELALSCDFIVASRHAKMGLPEVGLGLIPGYGGTQRLSKSVGKSLAKAVTLSGEMFTAEQFYLWGLVVEVADSDQLMERGLWWANKMATKSPSAIKLAKKAIEEGFDKEQREGLALEAQLFSNCFLNQDQKEGVAAFLEKRKPQFTGL